MTCAPSDVPGGAPGVPTAAAGVAVDASVTSARRRVAVAAVASLLVVLAVAVVLLRLAGSPSGLGPLPCAVVSGERDVRPPAQVRDAAARVRLAVADSGADVRTTCSVPLLHDGLGLGRTDAASDPAPWVVGADVVVDDVAGLARAADALLAVADPGAPFGWRLDVQDVTGGVAVALEPGGGTARVADALALRAVPGVSEVWFGRDDARVSVLASGLVPLLAATAGRDLPVTTVVASAPWVEVQQVHPGAWPAADVVALAADVAGWEGVWRVVLRGGSPDGLVVPADLTVEADDAGARADVAQRLADLGRAGPAVTYHVSAGGVAVDGVLGAVGAAGDVVPGGDAFDGVARCTGEDLDVEVRGTDAALGSRFLLLRATHTGTAPCVVEGFPDLAFTRESGTRTPDVTLLPDLVAPDVPQPVLLDPGGAVDAQVRWGAMSTAQDPDVAVRVTVRAVPGDPGSDLALPQPLDVLAGATLEVGPWRLPWLADESG